MSSWRTFFRGFRRDAHPMAVMCGVVGALSAFYHDSHRHQRSAPARDRQPSPDRQNADHRGHGVQIFDRSALRVSAATTLGYTENFLRMCFSVPAEDYKVNPVLAKALDTIFILHADHEQNASTSTVRLAGSSGANPFACIAAGIACLWGPAHGGANEAALKMLEEIGTVDRIPEYVKKAKDKNDSFRLMGFGHRVYKNYDPRAKAMQIQCHAVLDELGLHDDPLLKIAIELEKIALQDEYFIEKKLYPNIDFYSGITLKALGFPTSHVHGAVRAGAHRGLDRAVEGNAGRPAPEDRPSPADLYRAGGSAITCPCRNASYFSALTNSMMARAARSDGASSPWPSSFAARFKDRRAVRPRRFCLSAVRLPHRRAPEATPHPGGIPAPRLAPAEG